jgi:serine/threonine protein phosphatase 1
MTGQIAFVGDVHGNPDALAAIWSVLQERGVEHTVFLGDYINKGPDSASVLSLMLDLSRRGGVSLLRGNHEQALLDGIATGWLGPFLKMGGAMTIRSYLKHPVGSNVWAEFLNAVPPAHLALLRGTQTRWEDDGVLAQHAAGPEESLKYRITAHRPVGAAPVVGPRSAQIDTGCGDRDGRLTALLWPSRDYVQVDCRGRVVRALTRG